MKKHLLLLFLTLFTTLCVSAKGKDIIKIAPCVFFEGSVDENTCPVGHDIVNSIALNKKQTN